MSDPYENRELSPVIPAKAGIHFRLCLFASSFGRLYFRAGRIGIERKNERRIP